VLGHRNGFGVCCEGYDRVAARLEGELSFKRWCRAITEPSLGK
jgi:hypothetical protein